MGGKAKGLLRGPGGESIVERWAEIFRRLGIPHVLVGEHPAYASLGICTIPDNTRAPGPLGGLLALLEHAAEGHTLAVACDMAHVSEALVKRLVDAPPAQIVAARRGGVWEPLFARYNVDAVLPVAHTQAANGRFSLQGVLNLCSACELPLDREQANELRDWDSPEDIDAAP
ncbi:MAG: NTP transferase domain-containing protein [Polyangiaceae bacterium]|nr:NTP transferase domain-containing protein [Polyangiaceae bacterium]